MSVHNSESFQEQLRSLNNDLREIIASSKHTDLSDHRDLVERYITSSVAAVERIAGADSAYARRVSTILGENHYGGTGSQAKHIAGVLDALARDLSEGWLVTHQQLVHASVFSDYLEMADHLLEQGFRGPAAVLAGSTLEVHLKKLSVANGLELTEVNRKGKEVPKNAGRLNDDLLSGKVYSQLEHKNVMAWLALRNKAAHGQHDEFDSAQVRLLIDAVSAFLARHPA